MKILLSSLQGLCGITSESLICWLYVDCFVSRSSSSSQNRWSQREGIVRVHWHVSQKPVARLKLGLRNNWIRNLKTVKILFHSSTHWLSSHSLRAECLFSGHPKSLGLSFLLFKEHPDWVVISWFHFWISRERLSFALWYLFCTQLTVAVGECLHSDGLEIFLRRAILSQKEM